MKKGLVNVKALRVSVDKPLKEEQRETIARVEVNVRRGGQVMTSLKDWAVGLQVSDSSETDATTENRSLVKPAMLRKLKVYHNGV